MAVTSILIHVIFLTLFGSELVKADSKCNGTVDYCCLNGGSAYLNGNCSECNCPTGFSGEYCEVAESVKKIAKYTLGSPYWSLEMSSEDSKHPIRKSLRRKRNKGSFDNFASFSVGDQNPNMTLRFQGDGEKELQFLKGEFITSIDGSSVGVSALDENGEILYMVETFTFTKKLNRYEKWAYKFNDTNVQGVQFNFSSSCSQSNCFGINNMYGEYLVAVADPRTCDGYDCGSPDLVAYFENGCCNCKSNC